MPKAESAAKKAPAKKAAAKKAVSKPAPAAPETEELGSDDWFAPVDDTVDFTNTLLYGREGSGKTTAAARLANKFSDLPAGKGRILIINAEGGVKKRPLQNRGVDTSRVVLWPDPSKHQRVTHQSLDQIHRRVKADLEADPTSWGGVVFDSATEIHMALLDTVQQKRVAALTRQGRDVDPDFVDIADYGTMSKLFRDLLRKFRDLPCHFVVTALERRDVDKDTGKPQYGPAVTPGLQSDLLGYVDFVLMCKAGDEDGPFRALTQANSRYRAKDRFDVLPRVMVDPFVDRVVSYVDGSLTAETDAEQERISQRAEKAQDAPGDDEEESEEGDD
jgi:hypothetical protein